MTKVEHEGKHLTTKEVADLLGVSVATVNRRADKGLLPEVAKAPGVRGARLFDRAKIEALAKDEVAA